MLARVRRDMRARSLDAFVEALQFGDPSLVGLVDVGEQVIGARACLVRRRAAVDDRVSAFTPFSDIELPRSATIT